MTEIALGAALLIVYLAIVVFAHYAALRNAKNDRNRR